MVSFKQILLLSVVLASVSSKVTVANQIPDMQLVQQDIVQFDLDHIFDGSQAKGEIHYATNVGHVFNKGEAFAYKTFTSEHFTKPNWTEAHGEWTITVFDNTKVVFQTINADGRKFAKNYLMVDVNITGSYMTCTDTVWNLEREIMYIGCFNRRSSSTVPGAVYIFEYSVIQQKVVSKVVVPQTDGFRIINRLRMFIGSFPQADVTGKTVGAVDRQEYLVVYDQGHTIQKESV